MAKNHANHYSAEASRNGLRNEDYPESTPMQIGMIGLGRMGGNMVRRLMKGGHQCVAFDHSAEQRRTIGRRGRGGLGFARSIYSAA